MFFDLEIYSGSFLDTFSGGFLWFDDSAIQTNENCNVLERGIMIGRFEKKNLVERKFGRKFEWKITSVNGSFTSRDRHVRGVGDQSCTLHDRFRDPVDLDG